ncbi:MAG: recombination mediator RecR [Desulfatibacillaceae bacterium]
MSHYPPALVRLVKQLAKLPGIGEKSGERLAMHIVRAADKDARGLAESILEVKDKVRLCSNCFGLADTDPCHVCADPARDSSLLCVVEQPSDMVALERSGAYRGLYHVLQGVLSPLSGMGPDNIRLDELVRRVAAGGVKEVIIATGTGVEGQSTASYIHGQLAPMGVRTTRIASGVPVGGDLKYADGLTLKHALDGRHGM